VANPDEDTPRLVLADEVEADAPLYAEFIRVQVELAGMPPEPTALTAVRWLELRTRQRELWDALADTLTAGAEFASVALASDESWVTLPCGRFGRGFPEAVAATTRQWRDRGPKVVRTHPTTARVALVDREPAGVVRIEGEWTIVLLEDSDWADPGAEAVAERWCWVRRWFGPSGSSSGPPQLDPEQMNAVAYCLPPELFDELTGGEDARDDPEEFPLRRYATQDEAIDDLSGACLRWAAKRSVERANWDG
jgi:uncharacterized protein (TIGR02996 family)